MAKDNKTSLSKLMGISCFISMFLLGMFCGSYVYQPHKTGRIAKSVDSAVIFLQEEYDDEALDQTAPDPVFLVEKTSETKIEVTEIQQENEILENNIVSESETLLEPEVILETEPEIVETLPRKRIILNKLERPIPMIAIVIDDMGINQKRTKDILTLNAPLTSSFLTYGKDLDILAQKALDAGHEIMIHAPMEPKVPANLAPDTLKVEMDKQQIEKIFNSMLSKFNSIPVRGINNHMGSKFTEDQEKLGFIMDILKQNSMFFLDSKTTSKSKGKELAIEGSIDFVARDVFLDNDNDYKKILKQLELSERIAKQKGFAIAICHPKSQTYLALKDWLAKRDSSKIELVHVSQIVKAINQFE